MTDKVIVVGDLWEDNGHSSMAGRVYSGGGIAPTIGASHFQQIKYVLVKDKLTWKQNKIES